MTTSETPKYDPLDNPAVNQAAKTFMSSFKTARHMVTVMPKKSVARVYNAVMEFPLSGKEPKFRDAKENELFLLTLEILTAKNEMMKAIIEEHNKTENLLKEAQESFEASQESEGVVNG